MARGEGCRVEALAHHPGDRRGYRITVLAVGQAEPVSGGPEYRRLGGPPLPDLPSSISHIPYPISNLQYPKPQAPRAYTSTTRIGHHLTPTHDFHHRSSG